MILITADMKGFRPKNGQDIAKCGPKKTIIARKWVKNKAFIIEIFRYLKYGFYKKSFIINAPLAAQTHKSVCFILNCLSTLGPF